MAHFMTQRSNEFLVFEDHHFILTSIKESRCDIFHATTIKFISREISVIPKDFDSHLLRGELNKLFSKEILLKSQSSSDFIHLFLRHGALDRNNS